MIYYGLDGLEKNHSGTIDFVTKVKPYPDWHPRSKGEGRMVLTSAQDLNPAGPEDLFHLAKSIISSSPSFIRGNNLPWLLSYTDRLCEILISEASFSAEKGKHLRTSLSAHDVFDLGVGGPVDAISATRFIHTFEVIKSICNDYSISTENCYENTRYDDYNQKTSFLGDSRLWESTYSPRNNKGFKSSMTSRVFNGAKVIVSIPPDEDLLFKDSHGNKAALEGGSKFPGTITRYYETEAFWTNKSNYEFFPTIRGEAPKIISSTPLMPMSLDMASDAEERITKYAFKGRIPHGFSFTIGAFVPLHWISHIHKDGVWCEVSSMPMPVASEYDPKGEIMSTQEFTEIFLG